MNFTFEYQIADKATQIVVSIDDAIVAEAQQYGIDLVGLENHTKAAIDNLFNKVTASSFWHRAMHGVEASYQQAKTEVKELLGVTDTKADVADKDKQP